MFSHNPLAARRRAVCFAASVLLVVACVPKARAQTIGYERDRGLTMLRALKEDIKKYYYDPSFRGIDLDARFKAAEERIKQAAGPGPILAIIAQVLVDFDDSHLYFVPPPKASRTEYGWQMQMVGDKAYVVAVQPKSDAEAKGLRPGDEIYALDGYEPTRANLWKMRYFYYGLRPRPAVRLEVIKPDGRRQELEVKSKVIEGRRVRGNIPGIDFGDFEREAEESARLSRHRFYEGIPDLLIWKMPQFDLSDGEVDDAMNRARKRSALILDLRGNGGGLVKTLARLVGNFFDRDVKIGDRKGRKEQKPEVARTRGKDIFTGRLVVLTDSDSGSAAEVFARVVQLEKRGTVIGDRTAGAVMEARQYPHEVGTDIVTYYAASVTVSDLIMGDGKSLEKIGVTPDELLLPTAADMAAGRDPVLSRAAALLGFKLDPEQAGALFPIEWRN